MGIILTFVRVEMSVKKNLFNVSGAMFPFYNLNRIRVKEYTIFGAHFTQLLFLTHLFIET